MPQHSLLRTPVPLDHACAVAAQHASSADKRCALAEEVVDALTAAGFARHFVPREQGGQPGTFAELSQRVIALGSACPSAAWCAVIQAVTGRMAAYLPPLAQTEIWSRGLDVRLSASFRCTGTVETTAEGWRLSGTWHYLSGIDFARWALVLIEPKGQEREPRFAAVPSHAWRVLDDWQTLGMRGTGSRSITLDDVHVPSHMTFARSDLVKGRARHAQGPQYQASPVGSDPALFLSCALGAASHCLEQWAQVLGAGTLPNELAIAYASACSTVDTCRLLLRNACELTDQGELTPLQVARNARDGAFAAQLLLDAMNRVFRLSGAHAHYSTSQLQKTWRDVQTLTSHIALRPEFNFISYANQALAPSAQAMPPLMRHQ